MLEEDRIWMTHIDGEVRAVCEAHGLEAPDQAAMVGAREIDFRIAH